MSTIEGNMKSWEVYAAEKERLANLKNVVVVACLGGCQRLLFREYEHEIDEIELKRVKIFIFFFSK